MTCTGLHKELVAEPGTGISPRAQAVITKVVSGKTD